MKQSIFTLLENALNRYLSLDPEIPSRLKKLHGKIVTIALLGLDESLQLVFTDEKIHLQQDQLLTPDTIIKGTPLSLLHLSLTKEDRKRFFVDDVSIEGDLELGQQVIDLFDQLEIDWEEYLSRCVGDVPAHQVSKVVKNIKTFTQRVRERLLQNVNEYVHEEIELFPSAEALRDFFVDVDDLRMDIDRMEARITHLKKQIGDLK